jgi:hypothetical protein
MVIDRQTYTPRAQQQSEVHCRLSCSPPREVATFGGMDAIPETSMTLLRLVAAGPFLLTFTAEPTIQRLEELSMTCLIDVEVIQPDPSSLVPGRKAVVRGLLRQGREVLRS